MANLIAVFGGGRVSTVAMGSSVDLFVLGRVSAAASWSHSLALVLDRCGMCCCGEYGMFELVHGCLVAVACVTSRVRQHVEVAI